MTRIDLFFKASSILTKMSRIRPPSVPFLICTTNFVVRISDLRNLSARIQPSRTMVVEQVFMTQSKKIPKLISFRRCYQNSDGWVYFPEDPFKDIKFVCHMINTQLVVEVMVDLVLADEMYEKVGKALEILWWKPKNWTGLKIIRLLRKPVWYMFVYLFVSIQSTRKRHQKCQKKVKGGMTCKVSPVAMFVYHWLGSPLDGFMHWNLFQF